MNFSQFFKTNPLSTLLLCLDAAGLIICFNLAHIIRLDRIIYSQTAFLSIFFATMLCLYALNSYTIETPNKALRVVSRTIIACLVALFIAILSSFLIGRAAFVPIYGRSILFIGFLLFTIWACVFRYLITRFSMPRNLDAWLFIGSEKLAEEFSNDFANHRHSGNLVCHVCNTGEHDKTDRSKLSEYLNLIKKPWNGVIIDSLNSLPKDISADLLQQRLSGMKIFTLTEYYSKLWTKVPIFHIGQQWLMDVDGFSLLEDSVNYKLKRIFDFLLSSLLSVICLPLIIIIGISIRMTSEGPALYKQTRVGLNGKTFQLYKFRTMVIDAEKEGPKWTSLDDPRITQFGNFLRQIRLDEIPQIYNVLVGHMSFIGPRPERPEFVSDLENQIPYYDLRHLVKPGITGWAQVMYDYGASIDDAREKLQYDLFYIKNQSVLLDSIILLKTIKTIMNAKGR